MHRKAEGKLGRGAGREHREQLARWDGSKHDPGKVVALDGRIRHGWAIAERSAGMYGHVIGKVEISREEVRAQVDPSFERVARRPAGLPSPCSARRHSAV